MANKTHRNFEIKEQDGNVYHVGCYLVAALLGAVCIVALKYDLYGERFALSAVQASFVPVVILFLYIAIVLTVPKVRLRPDAAGDNAYYLGFTYTLISLAVALYNFASSVSVEITSSLIQNFGIALTSTIAGIVLRVLLNQFRTDHIEIERQSRQELAEASRELRVQLSGAATEFSSFQSALAQSMRDSFEELRDETQKTAERTFQNLEQTIASSASSIEQSYKALAEKSQRINGSTNDVIDAMNALAIRMQSIQLPTDFIEQQLRPAIESIRELAEQQAKLQKDEVAEREKFKQNMANLAQIAEAGDKMRASANTDMSAAFKGVKDQADAVAVLVGNLETAIRRLTRDAEQFGSGLTDSKIEPALQSLDQSDEGITSKVDAKSLDQAPPGPRNRMFGWLRDN